MHLFYTPELNPEMNDFILNEEESRHCVKVLRLDAGDELILIDGKGGWYEASIRDPHHKRCVVQIHRHQGEHGKRNFHLHIALAPTKNIDRFEWFLEKSAEIGIDEITPIVCQQSERKVIKQDRSERVLIAAMKQSLKAYLPQLNELKKFKALIEASKDFNGKKFIAHCQDKEIAPLKEVYSKGEDVLLLIGPEGDFSPEEIQLAEANGFQAIHLGEARLRTETAGVVATHSIHFLNA